MTSEQIQPLDVSLLHVILLCILKTIRM